MRYLPHTDVDVQQMLEQIGVSSIEELFSGVPENCRLKKPLAISDAKSESELLLFLKGLAEKNSKTSDWDSFLGGGAYNHFIPTVIDQLVSRSEFYTAYTPYQPEISQGTLQAIFEYQTMICQLTGMDVANASMYDGASACAEAALLAIRAGKKRHKVLLSQGLPPQYRETVATYCRYLDVDLIDVPLQDGVTSQQELSALLDEQAAAVIVGYPNYFGQIEDLAAIAELTHTAGARLVTAVSEPLSLALFKAPGALGADVVVGEGQSFGIPLSYGGPGIGFFAVRKKDMRVLPGRLVGETVDQDGKRGFVLTLATREQHIRREKATSNICSNQGMCVLMVSIYLALYGKQGLRKLAELNYAKATYAKNQISQLKGFAIPFAGTSFNEFVVTCPEPVARLKKRLEQQGILAGISVGRDYSDLKNGLLICVTEQNSREQIDRLVLALAGGEA
ncbi:glycine dehydrogenase (decarboxylating) alpha subunit [Desulfuromusa kysingii]|uniref:Probable glycine dehydrogenase (decarboxylating) subunit 1 n=2 Tax=Desulfuromusa kysingii TaxID=37625 RepID=A0A1H3YP94_9BACT|nr:aminomethyl-transferring glycine dehydrogenase subunit GcvPA [Desulfuromusa kysingii]SEA13330.1 glycine dehydrogenase (decarboxylating) alpha subunit [Desulfuromusa kysingii]